MNNFKSQQGFTLIELVVVIVLLGILAVTAAPKFIDLQDDARTATIQGIKASMQTASALVHGKSLIKGNESTAGVAIADPVVEPFVLVNNIPVSVNFGYPASVAGADTQWTTSLIDVDSAEFTTTVVDDTIVIYPASAAAAPDAIPVAPYVATATANCFAFFTQSTANLATPNIQAVECI